MSAARTPGPFSVVNGKIMCDAVIARVEVPPSVACELLNCASELAAALHAIIEGLELRGLTDGWDHDPQMLDRARAALKKVTP